jgi:RHS repeat-associated protein
MHQQRHNSRICRKKCKVRIKTDDSITKYAHNAQAQRVFKTAPLYAVTNPTATATQAVLDAFTTFFESLWSPTTATTQKAGMSYVYDEDGTLIADTLTGGASTTWGQSAKYIHLPTASGPMPVAAIYGTKHYAIQSDHLNTPRRLIQSDGQVAWQWAYSAFGDEKPTVASNRFANTDLNQSFGTTTVPAVTFNLRYPGQYFDQESNLHYNYHRSYSAAVGRYTQSDPIGLDGGWNRFGYAEGNPISKTDPTGLYSWVDVPLALANYCTGAKVDWSTNIDAINFGDIKSRIKNKINEIIGGTCSERTIPVAFVTESQTEGADRFIIGQHNLGVTGSVDLQCDCSWKFYGEMSSHQGIDIYNMNQAKRAQTAENITTAGREACKKFSSPFDIYIKGSKAVFLSGKKPGVSDGQCCR